MRRRSYKFMIVVRSLSPWSVLQHDRLRTMGYGLCGSQTTPIGEDVLRDIIIGGGARPLSETICFQFFNGLLWAAAVFFHSIDANHHAGAVQSGAAMGQDGIVRGIVEEVQKTLDGYWALSGRTAPRNQIRRDVHVANTEPPA